MKVVHLAAVKVEMKVLIVAEPLVDSKAGSWAVGLGASKAVQTVEYLVGLLAAQKVVNLVA